MLKKRHCSVNRGDADDESLRGGRNIGKMLMGKHDPRFLKVVEEAKTRIRETTVEGVRSLQAQGTPFHLVDVREQSEWDSGRLPQAIHLGKGVIERDIEQTIPDTGTHIVLYCGGGFRSGLAADNLQKMGYTQVLSMDGGIRAWREAGYPIEASP